MINGLDSKVLRLETINPHVVNIEYAVRGPIVQRALQIEEALKKVICVQKQRTCRRAKNETSRKLSSAISETAMQRVRSPSRFVGKSWPC